MELFSKLLSLNKRKLKLISRNYFRMTKDFLIVKVLGKTIKPNFLIAGVQKSGTSALAYYLNQHPDLKMSYHKEVNYFSSSKYHNGDNWYSKQFPGSLRKVKYFEATPDYLYSQNFAERLFKYNKNIKIILILRDPVKRAYSAWNMFKEINNYEDNKREAIITNNMNFIEDKKNSEFFSEFIRRENYPDFRSYINMELEIIKSKPSLVVPGFIRYGIYYEQIKRLLNFFSLDQILIVENNELKKDRVQTLRKIFNFLEVNNSLDIDDISNIGVRKYEKKIEENDKNLLKKFYQPYNHRLFELIGKKFDWD